MQVRLEGVLLDVWSNVYPPKRSTKMLIKNMDISSGAVVLDLGCGTGIIGLIALRRGAGRVVCLDISVRACRNALENFRMNNLVEMVDVVVGDGSSCLRDASFDMVVLNPPMTPSPRPLPRYTWGGIDGREFLNRHLHDVPRLLKSNGQLLITASSLIGIGWVAAFLERHGLIVRLRGYELVKCGRLLRQLMEHIRSLSHASLVYLSDEPYWLLAVIEGRKKA